MVACTAFATKCLFAEGTIPSGAIVASCARAGEVKTELLLSGILP